MNKVKVNIFISYAPEDKPQLQVLLKWLYPMRDEVNIWYNQPPPAPEPLPLPWQILLFWYKQPDFRPRYARILQKRRERAHIYIFLSSYKSLINKSVDQDIDVAAHRRINGDDFSGPFLFNIILSPCRWRETSRLAAYDPMLNGKSVAEHKNPDEAWLSITESVAALAKLLYLRLNEEKFYSGRRIEASVNETAVSRRPAPYLGEDAELHEFRYVTPFKPHEYWGWVILFFLFLSAMIGLLPERKQVKRKPQYGPFREYQSEYPRPPVVPPDNSRDSFNFPTPD